MEAALLGRCDKCYRVSAANSPSDLRISSSLKSGKGLVETQSFRGRAPEEEAVMAESAGEAESESNRILRRSGSSIGSRRLAWTISIRHRPFLSRWTPRPMGLRPMAPNSSKAALSIPRDDLRRLNNNLSTTGPESALLLERDIALAPGESRTMYFLYGYLPEGFDLDSLDSKIRRRSILYLVAIQCPVEGQMVLSSGPMPSHGWKEKPPGAAITCAVASPTTASFGSISFPREPVYQYIAGLAGCGARSAATCAALHLQRSEIVREVIRYTLKEIQPDGSIPYGIVGSGVPMPCRYRPSDQEMWLLWLASEYVLATRDKAFLDEKDPCLSRPQSKSERSDRP